ncbi:MAG: hypothetical protein LBD32_02260 [Cytophagales bacterium]|jgi:hypothetical protein|nr:hypothetical protein [Cytophagales bacterium]
MLDKFFKLGKIVFICVLSVISVGCSSSFNVNVDVNVHFDKKGSGVYAMTINLENLKKGFVIFRNFKKNELIAYEYITKNFAEIKGRVQDKYYMNKVSFVKDPEEQKFKFSFTFGSVDELNDIIKLMYGRQIFRYDYRTDRKTKDKKFVLTNQITSLEDFGLKDFIRNDDTKIKWFSIETMLSNIEIFRTYSFEEDIKRVNTNKIKVSEDKKIANIESNLWKFTNPKNAENKVHYVIAFN